MALSIGITLAYSLITTPVYTATATVLLPEQQASAGTLNNSQPQDPSALQRTLSDAQQFAEGDAVERAATKALGRRVPVDVTTSASADLLIFTANSTNKVLASQAANAYAAAFIDTRRETQVSQYAQQVDSLENSISSLERKKAMLSPSDPQQPAIQQSIDALTQTIEQAQATSQLVGQLGPTVLRSATVPSSPSSPKTLQDVIIGCVAGIAIGILLAFLVERFDDRIKSRTTAEEATDGVPVIATLPMVDAWRNNPTHGLAFLEDPSSLASEAYRTLRTAVQFLLLESPRQRVVVITSSVAGEGKSTAAANLALSLATVGKRVILVSADLRRPSVHKLFDLPNDTGLTSVLVGACSTEAAIKSIPNEPLLSVMPSGPIPPNPSELLALDKTAAVMDELRSLADVVLLDCPPVTAVADSLTLAHYADTVLLLASVDTTSLRALRRASELLAQIKARASGIILNKVPATGAAYVYGGYYESYHPVADPGERYTTQAAQRRDDASKIASPP